MVSINKRIHYTLRFLLLMSMILNLLWILNVNVYEWSTINSDGDERNTIDSDGEMQIIPAGGAQQDQEQQQEEIGDGSMDKEVQHLIIAGSQKGVSVHS